MGWHHSTCPENKRAAEGFCLWADQGSQGTAAIPVAGPGEGERRVALDRSHPQPAEAVPVPAVTTTGAAGSDGMKGSVLGKGAARAESDPHRCGAGSRSSMGNKLLAATRLRL